MSEEIIEITVLPNGGPVAGIEKSSVGPGAYTINWTRRTIAPYIAPAEAIPASSSVPAPAEEAPAPVETPDSVAVNEAQE